MTLDKEWTKTWTRTPSKQKESISMRYINALALLLVIVGGVNWLLVGIARFDLVATLTGSEFGETNALSSIIYILVGLAAVWLLPMLARLLTADDQQVRVTS